MAVLERLQANAALRARFGYRRLHILLEREDPLVNHKRIHLIYRRWACRSVAGAGNV